MNKFILYAKYEKHKSDRFITLFTFRKTEVLNSFMCSVLEHRYLEALTNIESNYVISCNFAYHQGLSQANLPLKCQPHKMDKYSSNNRQIV